ncbi:MAG TPA: hypothetical protein VMH79_15390 [Thermoanaerobaculia bacterium]|nr:hypothetical protein [Thermoanaerobaculia bacterium]
MARKKERAPAVRRRAGLDARAAIRLLVGFAAGLAFWFAFAAPYEKAVAAAAEALVRLFEHPAVTTLSASGGEILVDRSDFPPASPRPGLPADDLHFNFVLLATLFALGRRPLEPRRFGRFWLAALSLAVIHVIALVFQVEALYATRLGPWSEAHYGPLARNFWGAGFHFYQIAGRFAAPFALWWGFGRDAAEDAPGG